MNQIIRTHPIVLVVEDDSFIREVAVDFLKEAGFDVLEATSADEALRVFARGKEVRVLFTDIQMPGSLDGLELARWVHNRWPDVHLLITSGQVRPAKSEIPDDGRFLAKPYSPGAMVKEVERMAA